MDEFRVGSRKGSNFGACSHGESEAMDRRSELVRLAARLIIEEALEGEARDALGRDYYARGGTPGSGYRNGWRPGRLKSAEGAIDYSAPQIADRAEPFLSRIREILGSRTEELEALAVEMYARGLSTRDIEALFADGTGKSLLIRAAERWRCLRVTEFERRQLKAIKEELDRDFAARTAPAAGATVTASPT